MMESPPTQTSSTVERSTRCKDPDSLCDRVVTGNPDLDNWIWMIEYFAKFKTELSMLHDVFEMGPKLPDYLGEHTNEMVAFRCLVSLFDSSTSGQSQDVVSDANSKIEFDTSESCEYVLQCILDEIPLSELKPGAPGLSKWNLLPFIESKLLSLPKCAFELMIEPPCGKDSGVSPCSSQIDGKETDQITPRMTDPDHAGGKVDRHGPGPGDEDGDETSTSHVLLERRHEGCPNEDDAHVSSPSDNGHRCIQCKESGKLLFCSSDGCAVMIHEKCMDLPPSYDHAGNFHCSRCALTSASAEYLQFQDEDGAQVSIPSENGYRCIQCKESGKLLFCSSDGCAVMVHEKCMDLPPSYDHAGNFYCSSCALTSASAEYSQFQDEDGDQVSSPSENGYRCIQCKESGKLLFCSSDGCEVMVHEKCTDLPPSYDHAGNFYCSRCALTSASAEYLQFQDEVAKAEKKLVLFMRLLSQVNKKKSFEGS